MKMRSQQHLFCLLHLPPSMKIKSLPPTPSPPGTSNSVPPNTSNDNNGGDEIKEGGTTTAKQKRKRHKRPAKANSGEVDTELTVWETKKRYCKLAISNAEFLIHVDQRLKSTIECRNITCQCLNVLSNPILRAPVVKCLLDFERKSKYN